MFESDWALISGDADILYPPCLFVGYRVFVLLFIFGIQYWESFKWYLGDNFRDIGYQVTFPLFLTSNIYNNSIIYTNMYFKCINLLTAVIEIPKNSHHILAILNTMFKRFNRKHSLSQRNYLKELEKYFCII